MTKYAQAIQQIVESSGCHMTADQIFIQLQGFRYSSGNLGYLQGMGQPVPVMISLWCQKYLRLILHSAECLAVQDPVTIPLIDSPDITFFFLTVSSTGTSAVCCIGT